MNPFDAHFHLLPEVVFQNASFYNEAWGDAAGHMSAMDGAGVGRALVSYPTSDFHIKRGLSEHDAAAEINEGVKKLADASGGRLSYLAVVPLSEPDIMIEGLGRARQDGASGLSVPTNSEGVYPDDPMFLPFFETAERYGMPIFFHPTILTPFGHSVLRHPLITPVFQYAFDTTICLAKVVECGLLDKFPRLKLVLASFGGAMPFFAGRFDRTYRMLLSRGIVGGLSEDPADTLKKIYVDTSGAASPAVLMLALEVFGEDRLLWGSDYPANRDIAGSIEAIKGLPVSESAKEKILGGNLNALLAM